MRRMGQGESLRATLVARYVFATVALVAGVVGVIMLIAPDSTDTYFSWPIGPPALAATVGGCYVGSAVAFALGAMSPDWYRIRALCFGGLGLTVPTLVATIYDRDVFDFSRFLALTWLVLFIVSPFVFAGILIVQRHAVAPASSELAPTARVTFSLLAVGYTFLAVYALIDPVRLGEHGPFPMAALSGRYLGSWCAFLLGLAGYASLRNQRGEAFIPAVGLTVVPLGALVGALRTHGDLVSGATRSAYLAVLVVLFLVGAGLVSASRTVGTSGAGVSR